MALLELKLRQIYSGQEVLNIFNFLSNGTPATVSLSFGLVSAFGAIPSVGVYPTGTMLQDIRAIQSAALSYSFVEAKDVYSVTDFYGTAFNPNLAGAQAGLNESPVLAMGFQSNRVRSDIRRGSKRFSGVDADDLASEGVIAAGAVTRMQALATRLGANLTYIDEGQTITYSPVIVSKEKYTPDEEKPEKFAYRYYPTFSEQSDHLATGIVWDYQPRVRTQTSRQIGRGR
jgi:hypothetical protein